MPEIGAVAGTSGGEILPQITVKQPTLVFHGRMDETVKPELSTEFAWSRANVQLQFLDSDHQMLDVVETIWERVAMFYQETEPLRG